MIDAEVMNAIEKATEVVVVVAVVKVAAVVVVAAVVDAVEVVGEKLESIAISFDAVSVYAVVVVAVVAVAADDDEELVFVRQEQVTFDLVAVGVVGDVVEIVSFWQDLKRAQNQHLYLWMDLEYVQPTLNR